MPAYPANYPQPTWNYGQTITTYNERTQMECGWSRQRKTWQNAEGSSVNLEFNMDTKTFHTWIQWMAEFGYDWFTIKLDVYGGSQADQDVRMVTPIQYTYENFDTVRASVAGEFLITV